MTRTGSGRIHIVQRIDDAAVTELAAAYEVTVGYGPGAVDLDDVIGDIDVLVVRNIQLDNAVLDRARRLRLIVRAGSGMEGIDVVHARERGVEVVSTGGANARSVAEHVVALALAVARSVVRWDQIAREGGYGRRDEDPGQELFGKRWGVVGFGQIGREVAQMARDGLGMEVVAHVRRPPTEPAVGVEISYDLGTLLETCDVVSLHVPLTEETRGMIGPAEIARMRSSAILVNVARGPVVDADALLSALERRAIAGAAVDVWDGPFPDPPHRLYDAPNLVLSPHRGGRTREADRAAGVVVVAHVHEALRPSMSNPMPTSSTEKSV
ncbi:MAG: putative dehydrogenase related to phosphoglycerate dehydrogenase [Marmoricola sp.]|jgi:D-3-phosphoglycerate dehydrogenase|nr:putative dehydrogenase related to phosphoglycerate dehydrogenase [Marmoricola sp.]